MARTVYIIGNDGSGKSTYARRFERRAQAFGLRVIRRHYYDAIVRRLFRGLVESAAGVRQRKMAGSPAAPDRQRPAEPPGGTPRRHGSLIRRLGGGAFLWAYQTAMGVEMRLREWFSPRGVLLVDRGAVDDLISISRTLRLDVPDPLLRWTARLFPARQIIHLSAGAEVELSRIVDVDASPEHHRRKGELYDALISRLESMRAPVRRVNTAGHRADFIDTGAAPVPIGTAASPGAAIPPSKE